MDKKTLRVDWIAALYAVGGFAIGVAIGAAITAVVVNTLMCGLGYGMGYAIVGAFGGLALGIAGRDIKRLILQVLVGAISFGIAYAIGRAIAGAVDEFIGYTLGHYGAASPPGYAFESALTALIALLVTFAIGGLALGMTFDDKTMRLRLPLAGALGIGMALTILALGGLTSVNLVIAIATVVGGGSLGAMVGRRHAVRLFLLWVATGLCAGFFIGGIVGLFVGFGIRPDIIGAVLGVSAGTFYAYRITKRQALD